MTGSLIPSPPDLLSEGDLNAINQVGGESRVSTNFEPDIPPGSTLDKMHDAAQLFVTFVLSVNTQKDKISQLLDSRNIRNEYPKTDLIFDILKDIASKGDVLKIYSLFEDGTLNGEYAFEYDMSNPGTKIAGALAQPHFIFSFDRKKGALIISSPLIDKGKTKIFVGPVRTDSFLSSNYGSGFGVIIEPNTIGNLDERYGLVIENVFSDQSSSVHGGINVKVKNGRTTSSLVIRSTH